MATMHTVHIQNWFFALLRLAPRAALRSGAFGTAEFPAAFVSAASAGAAAALSAMKTASAARFSRTSCTRNTEAPRMSGAVDIEALRERAHAGDRDAQFTLGRVFAARQDFASFSLALIVQSGAWAGTRTAAAPSSASSIFSRDYRSYLVGGSVRVGDLGMLNVSLKHYDDRTSGNFDATQYSAAYMYSMSKRTDLYAGYSRLNNKRASSYSVSDASTAYTGVTTGASTSLLALGLKHTF